MPRKPHKSKLTFDNDSERVNEQIRISRVMLIDNNGQNLGEVASEYAKKMAHEAGLDLVEVAPQARPPVCRIMDYGKFRFEKSQKEKRQKGGSKSNKTKVIRLSPNIGEHDIDTKLKNIRKFLELGDKVLLQLRYKGRANAHKDAGFDIVEQITKQITDLGSPQQPQLQGAVLSCIIEPNKTT